MRVKNMAEKSGETGEEESEKKEEKNRQREKNCYGKKDWLDRKRLK